MQGKATATPYGYTLLLMVGVVLVLSLFLGATLVSAQTGTADAAADKSASPLVSGAIKAEVNASPDLVGLTDLEAVDSPHGALISWRTTNESGILGFSVARRLAAGVEAGASSLEFQPLTTTAVFAQHSGTDRGAAYSYRDESVQAGVAYDYVLDVIWLSGRSVRFDLPSLTTRWWFNLPLISASR
jgi:hypothetical protein